MPGPCCSHEQPASVGRFLKMLRGVHLCLRLLQRVLEPQIVLDVRPEIPRHFAVHFLWCAVEAEWRAQCGVFILPLSCWNHVNADSILVDKSDCQHLRPLPNARHQLYEHTSPCKKLVHSRSVEGAPGSMRRGFTLLSC